MIVAGRAGIDANAPLAVSSFVQAGAALHEGFSVNVSDPTAVSVTAAGLHAPPNHGPVVRRTDPDQAVRPQGARTATQKARDAPGRQTHVAGIAVSSGWTNWMPRPDSSTFHHSADRLRKKADGVAVGLRNRGGDEEDRIRGTPKSMIH